MATITLTIPDAQLPRVTAALCSAAGIPDTAANAKTAVIEYIKSTVKAVEARAAATARAPLAEPDVSGLVT